MAERARRQLEMSRFSVLDRRAGGECFRKFLTPTLTCEVEGGLHSIRFDSIQKTRCPDPALAGWTPARKPRSRTAAHRETKIRRSK